MMPILAHLEQDVLDLLFPKFCLFCQREGRFVCEDCLFTFDLIEQNLCLCQRPHLLPRPGKCRACQSRTLAGLHSALIYEDPRVRHLLQAFKYEPLLKSLADPLASLIITSFQLRKQKIALADFTLVPIPLDRGRLRWRGFNQAFEITKQLAARLQLPYEQTCLLKTKKTLPQTELSQSERQENIKGVFAVKDREKEKIKNKKILLIDDVYTTGSTMEEAARVLKQAGAREIWGAVIARTGKQL